MCFEAVGGVVEVALGNDVVAVEHRARLVPRDRHSDALGNACSYHVPYGRAPKIMEQFPDYTGALAGRLPSYLEVANPLSAPGKHVFAFRKVQVVGGLSHFQSLEYLASERNRPRLIVLRGSWVEIRYASIQIDLAPREAQDLTLARAGVISKGEHGPEVFGQLAAERQILTMLEESFANVSFLEHGDKGNAAHFGWGRFGREIEHA